MSPLSSRAMVDRTPYFATCAPGLEPILHREAKELGLKRLERQVGGVAFHGDHRDEWTANLWLRTAIRVLRRVERARTPDPDAIYATAKGVAWEDYVAPEGTLMVDARSRASAVEHTQFIEQRVKDAVVDRFRERTGRRPSVDKEDPDLRINAHLYEDRLTLSVDTSGHSLHRRGWRVHQGRAPLSETMAAALVLASGWNRRAPLVDPFCGTGTIVLEAALVAADRAPGLLRRFSFEGYPGHDARAFARFREEAERRARPLPRKLRLVGTDRSAERVAEAQEHAGVLGFEDAVQFEVADATSFAPREGWNAQLVTNPPYGQRVGGREDVEALYRTFGSLLRERAAGSSLTLLTGEHALRKALGFRRADLTRVINGGLECEIVRVERIEPSRS